LVFGALQGATIFAYSALALSQDVSWSWLLVLCVAEHLAASMATATLFTVMMDAVRPRWASTDYTIQASVVVIAQGSAAALSGISAGRLLYPAHFFLAGALCTAATAFAWWYCKSRDGKARFVSLS
jgi:hypothetical protein